MDCSLPGSSVHGIFQARTLEWVAISFSGGPSWGWPRNAAHISSTVRWLLYHWATRDPYSQLRWPHHQSGTQNHLCWGLWHECWPLPFEEFTISFYRRRQQAGQAGAKSRCWESQPFGQVETKDIFMKVSRLKPWIVVVYQNVSPALQNLFNVKQYFSPKRDPFSYIFLKFIEQVLCMHDYNSASL